MQDPAQAERLLDCYHQAVGHELPNHLVAIRGLTRLVLEQADALAPDLRDLLQRADDQAKRADLLVRGLEEFGRVVRRVEPTETVALADVWNETRNDALQRLAPLNVQFDAASELPRACVPPSALRRALVEVVLHRARHAEEGASLRFRISVRRHDSTRIEMAIADNGVPPAPESLDKLFDPFAESPACFGPLLARELIAAWRGQLHFEPGADAGCVTLITVPAAD